MRIEKPIRKMVARAKAGRERPWNQPVLDRLNELCDEVSRDADIPTLVDGIPVNPVLPEDFCDTANEGRPESHQKWWDCPYIETSSVEEEDAFQARRTDDYAEKSREAWATEGRESWMKAWPTGTRYIVRCLDGGAWDRPTLWGGFPTIEEAVECAKTGPEWRKKRFKAI